MEREPMEEAGNAAAAASAEQARPVDGPALSQAEIDALTSYAEHADAPDGDLRSVADAAAVAREPMPMLAVVLERLATGATARLKSFLKCNADLTVERVDALRYGEYIDRVVQPAQLFRFRIPGWDGDGLVTIGLASAYLILEQVLGGGGAGRQVPLRRPPTAIETRILGQIVLLLLDEAERAFAPLAPASFEIAEAETDPRAVGMLPPGETVVAATFRLGIERDAGEVELVLPLRAIEPIRPILRERFNGEKFGRDAVWAAHLATEVWQADIEPSAVLHEMRLPLGRALDLAVGDTLMLDVRPTDLVTLKCGDRVLTRGRIGRVDGRIAIQVTETLRHGHAMSGHDESLPV